MALHAVNATEAAGPLLITTDEKWQVSYEGDQVQFYTIKRTAGETALLMVHRWSAPGNADQIPTYLEQIAEGFLKEADKNPDLKLTKKGYEKQPIEGAEFSGEAVIFTVHAGLYQTSFMVSDGDGIWSGQFTGSKELWAEAIEIIQQLQRRD